MNFDESLPVNIFRYVISLITIAGNLLLLFMFYKFPKLRKSPCNCLVAMLNFCDLLIGIGVLIRVSYTCYANANDIILFDKPTCILVNSVQAFGVSGGQAIIVSIAFDRFIAIFRPTTYAKDNSTVFLSIVGVIAIIAPLYLFIAKWINLDTSKLITVCSSGSAAAQSFYLSNLVYCSLFILLSFVFYALALIFLVRRLRRDKKRTHEIRLQLRVFISVSLILLCCTIFYGIPVFLMILTEILKSEPSTKATVTMYIGFGSLINACANIFVYIFKHNEINKCFKILWKKWFPFLARKQLLQIAAQQQQSGSSPIIIPSCNR